MNNNKLYISVLALFIFLPILAAAQNDAVTRFVENRIEDDEPTRISISARMFSLFTNLDAEDPEDKELLEQMSRLKGMKILSTEEVQDGEALVKSIRNDLPNEYESLMTINDDDEYIEFLVLGEGDKVNELVMLIGSKGNFLAMSILGSIDLKQISRLSQSMDVGGMEKLEHVGEGN